jgi:hypothetical protein
MKSMLACSRVPALQSTQVPGEDLDLKHLCTVYAYVQTHVRFAGVSRCLRTRHVVIGDMATSKKPITTSMDDVHRLWPLPAGILRTH